MPEDVDFSSEDVEKLATLLCGRLSNVQDEYHEAHWRSRGRTNKTQWLKVAEAAIHFCGYGVSDG